MLPLSRCRQLIGDGQSLSKKELERIRESLYTLAGFSVGAPLGDLERRDILEILEDRTENRSTIVASQLPTNKWYDCVGEPTIADAILDRLIHRAHELKLKGPTMRRAKKKGKKG